MEEITELEMALSLGGDVVIDIGESSNSSNKKSIIQPNQLEKPNDQTTTGTGSHSSQDPLQILLEQKLRVIRQDQHKNQPFTIFRVPAYLREKNKTLYEPLTVSIGPNHHGKESLRTMEEHKRRCLCDILDRNNNIGLVVYLKELRELEMQARRCYSESIMMDSDQFVLLLLLDGCFILEYFLKWRDGVRDALTDTRCDNTCTDMLLLENQVPFFVIHKLSSLLLDPIIHSDCKDGCPLLDLIFLYLPSQKLLRKPEIFCGEVDNLLHFYYKCMVPEFHISQINTEHSEPFSMKTKCISWLCSWLPKKSREYSPTEIFPCATILNESGVIFKRKKEPRDMFDITFDSGIMDMPLLTIGDDTKIIFTNVIAFEQSQQTETTFTSFAITMDSLIDTGNDVTLLRKNGTIESLLETDEHVAAFFNHLSECTSVDHKSHYFASLFKQVNEYSNSTWPKYRARLLHDYFSNPWTSISVFAAAILLGLTVTQTYYAIYSAYHH